MLALVLMLGACADGSQTQVADSPGKAEERHVDVITPDRLLGLRVRGVQANEVLDVQPTAIPTPAPTSPPTPGQDDAREPPVPEPQPTPAPAPEREPSATGETIDGVTLTFYTCVGDSTGSYCGNMASGQVVHRGAVACGYAWGLGVRFRILGDPIEGQVYTCLDRGSGPYLWVDVWFYDVTEGRAWRNQLPRYVTLEMMP